MARTLVAGDDYVTLRPLYRHVLLDEDMLPRDLTGITIRSTYKPIVTDMATDPNDTDAPIKHTILVSSAPNQVSGGFHIVGDPINGTFEQRLTSAETAALPLGTELRGDTELTIPVVDGPAEVLTWGWSETLEAMSSPTNRTTG